jgi:hypothetical protein
MNFLLFALLAAAAATVTAFQSPLTTHVHQSQSHLTVGSSSLKSTASTQTDNKKEDINQDRLYVPSKRDAYYQGNVARYLLDLDEEGATFDFCGGEYRSTVVFVV